MFKRFISLLICATFLLGGTTTAFADEVAIDNTSGYSSSALVASTLTVSNKITDLPLIGEGGLVVDIPSELPLEYDRKSYEHTCETTVGVRGELSEFAMVYVTVPNEITYTLETDPLVTMTGEIDFQVASNSDGYVLATWTSAEAAEGKDDASLTNTKELSIVADGLNAVQGEYDAEITFEITVDKFGVFDAVGGGDVPNGADVFKHVDGSANATGNQWNFNFYDDGLEALNAYEYIDLNKLTIANGSINNPKLSTLTTPNTTVKYIKLNTNLTYELSATKNDISAVKTWCMGLDALEVIIVPHTITELGGKFMTRICSTASSTNSLPDSVYNGTDILIGNAFIFCIGINDTQECVYVPNIVFEGTMDEWIGLIRDNTSLNSRCTDWIFGNAANEVTVHCTDGTLLY